MVCDGVVYISGQVDLARNRDPKVQTAEVLKTIDDLLAKAGSDKEQYSSAHCLLVEYGLLFRDESGLGRMGEQNQSPGPIRPRVCTSRSVLESTDFNSRSCSGLTRRNLDKSDRFGKITHPFVEGGFCIRTAFFCLVVKEMEESAPTLNLADVRRIIEPLYEGQKLFTGESVMAHAEGVVDYPSRPSR